MGTNERRLTTKQSAVIGDLSSRKTKFLIVQGEFCKIIDVIPRRAGTGWGSYVF